MRRDGAPPGRSRRADRRVPPALAITPAAVVAAVVTAAGLGVVRRALRPGVRAEGWATRGPPLPWPLWEAALGAATLAYHYPPAGPLPALRADGVKHVRSQHRGALSPDRAAWRSARPGQSTGHC